jgi:hypothetical protein
MTAPGVVYTVVVGLLAVGGDARAKNAPKPQPHIPAVHVARPIPMLPSISRVRVEVARDRVLEFEEVSLPKGDWHGGGLDLYVSFGAPGTPEAVDARLVAVPAGSTESRWEDAGDPVSVDPAMRQGYSAQLLLGRPAMAGMVVRIKDADLRRVYASGDVAALRVRSLLAPPASDAQGGRDVVVRLGIESGTPLALGHIQVVSVDPTMPIARAEARLCGPEADTWPLAVAILPRPATDARAQTPPLPIAPVLAVRHASDDLCIRWWQ